MSSDGWIPRCSSEGNNGYASFSDEEDPMTPLSYHKPSPLEDDHDSFRSAEISNSSEEGEALEEEDEDETSEFSSDESISPGKRKIMEKRRNDLEIFKMIEELANECSEPKDKSLDYPWWPSSPAFSSKERRRMERRKTEIKIVENVSPTDKEGQDMSVQPISNLQISNKTNVKTNGAANSRREESPTSPPTMVNHQERSKAYPASITSPKPNGDDKMKEKLRSLEEKLKTMQSMILKQIDEGRARELEWQATMNTLINEKYEMQRSLDDLKSRVRFMEEILMKKSAGDSSIAGPSKGGLLKKRRR